METQQSNSSETKRDFRVPRESMKSPKAVADGGGGTIIAVVDIDASPERIFKALTTNEIEKWWGSDEFYWQKNWTGDLQVCGQWSVTVHLNNGNKVSGSGEFIEINEPTKVCMTRRFDAHPLLGTRDTIITYRLESFGTGTRLTVRDEGFIGRSLAAYGNAEHWERVLGWLAAYLAEAKTKQSISNQ